MKILGIICEYNPFHNGHIYHIEQSRRISGCDAVVCVMSGNYVQRGDVAIFDKNLRAGLAERHGADLVLELPASFSLQPAENFAKNAIFILHSLGCVDFLSFGAENSDIDTLQNMADFLSNESEEYKSALNEALRRGVSFPAARGRAVRSILGESAGNILKCPNNILAIEYLKALKLFKSTIKPIAVKRIGTMHDSGVSCEEIASASYIRELLLKRQNASFFLPHADYTAPKSIKRFEGAIIADLCKKSAKRIARCAEVSEGLENRIKAAAWESKDFEDLVGKIKTKRYTESKIRRILLSSYLGIYTDGLPPYINIMVFNEVGQQILNTAKKTATLPLIKNTAQAKKLLNGDALEIWFKELLFDKIYNVM